MLMRLPAVLTPARERPELQTSALAHEGRWTGGVSGPGLEAVGPAPGAESAGVVPFKRDVRVSGKGTSLNSTCLTPKPLAPSLYVHVPEAHFPHVRSISVMSLFPSLMVWRSHRDKSHVLDELDAVHHFFRFINLPDEQQARDDLPDAAGLLS